MSDHDPELLPILGQTESASSVKLTRNAKGETQIEVKVYATDTDEQLAATAARAQTVYDQLATRYGGQS